MLSESEDSGGDIGSQNQKSKVQALKRTTYHNHSCKGGTVGNADMVPHVQFHTYWTARVWFVDLPLEFVDSYDDLKKEFLANFLQQKKCIKDLVENHHIKQREEESTEDCMQRFKAESRHVKGALKCMRISGFMHVITNLELIKRLHDNIPKSMDEMLRVTTAFLRGEVAASNQRRDKFTLLTKSPKEILALDKGKFKTPPPMTTPIEKRNNNKFCEFHGEVRHNTDEYMHLRRQIKELIKAGKLSYVIKELKQGSRKDQPKAAKKGETSKKDKPLEILMVQPWQRVARQRITQSFSSNPEILFPPLGDEDGIKGPMIIEAEIGGKSYGQWDKFAASKNRGCEAFNLYMDEFCGGEITISVQWDHSVTPLNLTTTER
nr:reverse transcriptase domain-containing protein [Tanacetum cinerariifolium]